MVLKQCGQVVMILVTFAWFNVATFCWACFWNVYSSPMRRAGSPVQASRGPRMAKTTPASLSSLAVEMAACVARPEDGEIDPCLLEQLGRRDGGLLRAFVERRSAAHPEQHVGGRIARLQHPHVESLGPLRAVALRPTPRIRCAADVSQHRGGLFGKARLDHHQVAPQIDYVVDVLNADRALPHARPAGDAIPDHVVGDRVRYQR